VFSRALSLVEYWIRRRILVRRGLDPDRPCADALAAMGREPRRAGFLRRLRQDS